MKVFTFLMALLVLSLSILPCADAAAATGACKTEISSANDNDNDQQDACSPFCRCTCCAHPTLQHSPQLLVSTVGLFNIHFDSYAVSTLAEMAIPVWQPPQL